MASDTLSVLPIELQVAVLTYLPPQTADIVRLTCHRLKNLIEANAKVMYSGRLIHTFVSEGADGSVMEIEMHHDHSKVVTIQVTGNQCVRISAKPKARYNRDEGRVQVAANWGREMEEKFAGQPCEKCFQTFSERSGGIHMSIDVVLDTKIINLLLPLLDKASYLSISNRIEAPKEEAFRYLFAHKRELHFQLSSHFPHSIFKYRRDLLDDRFFSEAGTGTLYFLSLRLTDRQLFLLLERKDINFLTIRKVRGLSAEGIRNAIQKMLNSTMRHLSMRVKCAEPVEQLLKRKLGDEVITINEEEVVDGGPIYIRYILGNREATAKVSTNNVVVIESYKKC